MEQMIKAEDVTFSFGDTPIFYHVSFSVNKGDFVALTGANGSGKSTLFRILLGDLAPSYGTIQIDGEPTFDKKDWTRVGYVPQVGTQSVFSFPATAEEVVRTSLYPESGLFKRQNKEQREKVKEALRATGTENLAKKRIGDLSGGQRQRIMLSRVLVHMPDLLLLDEPASGIDRENSEILLELLTKLNRDRGMTILMITHDIGRVADIVSRVLCIEEGSLVELGREQIHEELAHRHKHPPHDHSPEEKKGGSV